MNLRQKFVERPAGTLLSSAVGKTLDASLKRLAGAGARVLAGGESLAGQSARYANTLLRVEGDQFLASPHVLQTEAFGNAGLAIVARHVEQARMILESFEGQLTGSIYSRLLTTVPTTGLDGASAPAAGNRDSDEESYAILAPVLRRRVGRLLNDKMPTGVAVSPAMNHGGPYPATGHPGFSAVGIPGSIRRFSQLECFDNVRPNRLPPLLRDRNPTGKTQRLIDGQWTCADVTA